MFATQIERTLFMLALNRGMLKTKNCTDWVYRNPTVYQQITSELEKIIPNTYSLILNLLEVVDDADKNNALFKACWKDLEETVRVRILTSIMDETIVGSDTIWDDMKMPISQEALMFQEDAIALLNDKQREILFNWLLHTKADAERAPAVSTKLDADAIIPIVTEIFTDDGDETRKSEIIEILRRRKSQTQRTKHLQSSVRKSTNFKDAECVIVSY